MIPEKPKSLCKEVAEELNVSTSLVEDLIEDYYKEIKHNVTNLKHLRINVDGLGQFVLKEKTVNNAIPKYKKALNNHDTSTFNAYHNKLTLEKKVEALENIQKQFLNLELKKQEVKLKKENYNKLNNL